MDHQAIGGGLQGVHQNLAQATPNEQAREQDKKRTATLLIANVTVFAIGPEHPFIGTKPISLQGPARVQQTYVEKWGPDGQQSTWSDIKEDRAQELNFGRYIANAVNFLHPNPSVNL